MAQGIEPQEALFVAVQGAQNTLPWRYLAASEHEVQLLNVDGVAQRTLTFGVDFSISPEGDTPLDTGVITLLAAPEASETQLRVRGLASAAQAVTPEPGTEGIVQALDRLTIIAQQLRAHIARVDVPTDIETAQAAADRAEAAAEAAALYDPAAKQNVSDLLTAISGLSAGANKLPYFTGADSAALADFPGQARSLLAAQTALAQRQVLALATVSGRNLVIDGSGRVNQGGYVSGTPTSGASQYTLDMWRVVVSGQSLTFTGDSSGRVMTAPAGGVEQEIEGASIVGGTYVLNWTGTASAAVNGAARAKGEAFTLPANTNAVIRLTGGTFSEVQLELEAVTPFERLSYAQEEIRCMRFYVNHDETIQHEYGAPASTFAHRLPVQFPVPMIAAPVVVRAVSSSSGASSISTGNITRFGFNQQVVAASNTNVTVAFTYTADARF